MNRVLLTAFEPYGPWRSNASWLTLVELTRDLPTEPILTTRLYPVDYDGVQERPGSGSGGGLRLCDSHGTGTRDELGWNSKQLRSIWPPTVPIWQRRTRPLVVEGRLAYASDLPAESMCQQIQFTGIPASVSRHAGTYLCNASLYFALRLIDERKLHTRAIFVHWPIDPAQAARLSEPMPAQSIATNAQALRVMLQALPRQDRPFSVMRSIACPPILPTSPGSRWLQMLRDSVSAYGRVSLATRSRRIPFNPHVFQREPIANPEGSV